MEKPGGERRRKGEFGLERGGTLSWQGGAKKKRISPNVERWRPRKEKNDNSNKGKEEGA